eukprot:964379_1
MSQLCKEEETALKLVEMGASFTVLLATLSLQVLSSQVITTQQLYQYVKYWKKNKTTCRSRCSYEHKPVCCGSGESPKLFLNSCLARCDGWNVDTNCGDCPAELFEKQKSNDDD